MANKQKLSLYYDGLCQLCSREIEHYRRQKGSENILFVDITSAEFNAEKWGLDPLEVHRVMHVKTSDGEIITKMDAFVAIWNELPKYQIFAKLAQKKVLRVFLDVGYFSFAKLRPFLPRRKERCGQSPYCELTR